MSAPTCKFCTKKVPENNSGYPNFHMACFNHKDPPRIKRHTKKELARMELERMLANPRVCGELSWSPLPTGKPKY